MAAGLSNWLNIFYILYKREMQFGIVCAIVNHTRGGHELKDDGQLSHLVLVGKDYVQALGFHQFDNAVLAVSYQLCLNHGKGGEDYYIHDAPSRSSISEQDVSGTGVIATRVGQIEDPHLKTREVH